MPKAKEIVLEDGWTRVIGGKPGDIITTGLPPLAKDATPERLLADYEKKRKVWQESSCRKEVHEMLDRRRPDDVWSLNKAVCLASGSFSRDNWQNAKRSMFQFVAFVDTVQYLQTQSSTSIKMYAQEPRYTEIDKAFLERLTVEAIEPNRDAIDFGMGSAKDHLGPQTIVFEFFMDMDTKMWSEVYTPATPLIIGSPTQRRLEELDKSKWFNLDEMFQKEIRSLNFPHFEEDPLVFQGLMLHWRAPKDDQDADED